MRSARTKVARLAGAIAALALLAGAGTACSGGDDDGAAPSSTGEPGPDSGPRAPADIAPGCGAQAVTAPDDLAANRAVARCGAGAPEADPLPAPTTVRVAVPPAPGPELAPLLLADALGEFEAENLTVETTPLDSAAAADALEAGEVDLVVGPVDGPYFDALHAGSDARLVLGGALSPAPNDLNVGQTGLWVRDDAIEDSNALTDLQLQPVSVPGGVRSAAAYPIGLALGQTEISLNDVALGDAAGQEAAEGLLSGDISAAWLDGGAWVDVAVAEGFHLAATLPASESVDGTIASGRLLGADREVGVAYARAVIRTINTYLTGDYGEDPEVVEALAEALGVEAGLVRDVPPMLFDWEVREGTTGRIEDALLGLGGVGYDIPLDEALLIDRSLAADAVGAPAP